MWERASVSNKGAKQLRVEPRLLALLFLLLVVVAFSPRTAVAGVESVTPDDTSLGNGDITPVKVTLEPTNGAAVTIAVTSSAGDAEGILVVLTCDEALGNCPAPNGEGSVSSSALSTSITVNELGLDSIELSLVVTCTEDGSVTITATEGATVDSAVVNCVVDGGGGGFGLAGQVIVKADPNLLPCKGGTSELTAMVIDQFGNEFPGLGFHFITTAGKLVQTSNNTAELTLGPAQTSATVTASIIEEADADANPVVKTATVAVALECNNFVSVVVTAAPNVVGCSGSSLITASARDVNGHVVKGLGFHFAVNTGGLISGPPNTANAEGGSAVLTLLPGMPSATVIVSVGTLLGTIEGTVTVQQYCPSAVTRAGAITLEPAYRTMPCGTSNFIAARVHDISGHVVPDGTIIHFLANSGEIPASGTAVGGTLHVVYKAAENVSGVARITAAGDASFGVLDINVQCAAPPSAAAAGGTISPPRTGSAGLVH